MKKVCFMVALFAANLTGISQNLDEINDLMGKFKYKEAKLEIDKFLKDNKNASKSDGWYFKGRIYNSLSKDSSVSMADALNYKVEAFSALKKLQEMDKMDIRLKLENYTSYFDLYNGFFDIGAKDFNSNDFSGAFDGFKNALLVEDYVRGKGYEVNGFKFPVLDTALVLNTAIAAKQAKNMEAAAEYYKKLEAANLSSQNNIDIYLFLAEYNYNKKDKNAFDALTAKARNYYPNEPYWEESYYENVEIDNAIKGLTKDETFKKYDEMLVKYPNNFLALYNYSIELYKFIYSEDTKPADVPAAKTRFEEVAKKTIGVKSTAEDNFLMANFLYNNSFDLSDESKKIKGPKSVELMAASKKAMDNCVPYAILATELFEKRPKLKAAEKSNYKQCFDMLSEIFRVKGDAKKSAEYKAKKEAII